MTPKESRTIRLSGPVRIDTVMALLQSTGPSFAQAQGVVDFSGATDIDSSALALMLQWRRDAESAGHEVRFINVTDNIRVLAELYGVTFLLQEDPGVGE